MDNLPNTCHVILRVASAEKQQQKPQRIPNTHRMRNIVDKPTEPNWTKMMSTMMMKMMKMMIWNEAITKQIDADTQD